MTSPALLPRLLLAAACLLALLPAAPAADQPIAFVNLERVFNEHTKTKAAFDQLKVMDTDYQKEREVMLDDYEKIQGELEALREEAQNTALSEDARAQKKSEWEEKLISARELESKIRRSDDLQRKRMDDKSQRMLKDIVDDIRQNLESFARKQGYLAVMDSSGKSLNRVEAVLYVDPKFDITDAFIAAYNSSSKGDIKTAE